jgi:hypothetical protein
MKLILNEIQRSLNRAYLKQDLTKEQIKTFKYQLKELFKKSKKAEHKNEYEEHFKNVVSLFLKNTFYKEDYEININKHKDLVIHNGKSSEDSVGVIIEAKKPSNESEMIFQKSPNAKALHELILYYFEERNENKNIEIKHILANNVYEWFIFDENEFDMIFYKNTKFQKLYRAKIEQSKDNPFFYSESQKIIAELDSEISCTYFNLKDYEEIAFDESGIDDERLIHLYKILSPEHLLKKPFSNDSNTLNKDFYNELLHIIGLEEKPDRGKKLIDRRKKNKEEGSLIENTINILKIRDKIKSFENPEQFGENKEDQLYSISLELCITWLNRILFLKLLEGQLIKYHNGNTSYSFINFISIKDFSELDELFFEVLAVKISERSKSVNEKFGNIPYLNSSLFEISELESKTIQISDLKDRLELTLFSNSILKNKEENKRVKKKNTLHYLFEFLSAFKFSSDSSAKIQEDNRNIINASVLGLIFEKINGYKDGSFFTPGFITMYICRETIRRTISLKFKELENINIESFEDLKSYCARYFKKDDILRFNNIIDSLKICDPSVGSGHFLVSALNEIICVKSELNILSDSEGIPLEYEIAVDDDELSIINKKTNKFFDYILGEDNKPPQSIQKVQFILFEEKKKIIENCLFGVDINPKSVLICRLRLWIELLKNAYYKPDNFNELETLPNIDINIKEGDSLVNRFNFSENNILPKDKPKIKEFVEHYKLKVYAYKNLNDKSGKDSIRRQIKAIKSELEKYSLADDDDFKRIRELESKQTIQFLHFVQEDKEKWLIEQEEIKNEIQKLKKSYEFKLKTIYSKAFEWRFEFPEVIDLEGKFVGFDLVIGNPPYIGEKDNSFLFETIKKLNQWKGFYRRRTNLYYFFIKLTSDLLKPNGISSMIVPREFISADWANKLRESILKNFKIIQIVDFNRSKIFEDANTTSLIYFFEKPAKVHYDFTLLNCNDNKPHFKEININNIVFKNSKHSISNFDITGKKCWEFVLTNINNNNKIIPLGLLFEVSQGIVTGADKVTQTHIEKGYISSDYLGRGIFILHKGTDIKIETKNYYLKINNEWSLLSLDESSYIKPYISSIHLNIWQVKQSTDFIIYFGNNKANNEAIINYLAQFKTILINRAKLDKGYFISLKEFDLYSIKDIKEKYSSAGAVQKIMKKKLWYLPLYERADLNFNESKIIVNSKNKNIFSYSNEPHYSSGGGLGGQNFILPDSAKDFDYYEQIKKYTSIDDYFKFINAILNSNITRERIVGGKYNQLSTNKIKELFIYKIDFYNTSDLDLYNRIISLVNRVLVKDSIIENSNLLNSLVFELFENKETKI